MADKNGGKLPTGKHRAAISKMHSAKKSIVDVATACFEEGLDEEAKELRDLANMVENKIDILYKDKGVPKEKPSAKPKEKPGAKGG